MAKEKEEKNDLMERIVSLAKRRGFVFQGSEIYGGLAGTYDWGPLGVALKNNVKNLWWKRFVLDREDMFGLDSAILMNQKVWQASGHARGFADMMVECLDCKKRYREDHLKDKNICPNCGGKFGQPQHFYMMLETHIGATHDAESLSYLRPETAQGMFVNFKNIIDSFHPKLPFGIAQIGKAFRNEISPRDFIFRLRELEQMEIEYFIRSENWENSFEEFRLEMHAFVEDVGLPSSMVHELEVSEDDRAHYSKRTIDFEFDFPFGRKELYGLAYRADYDLKNHTEASGVDLVYFDEETKEKVIPHVIEPSLGVDRTILAILSSSYTEDELGGEKRVYLAFKPSIAPIKAMVSPLLKNKPELVAKAREVYDALKSEVPQVMWDDNGNIGKRYRRQDEIGTPFCITIDFDTLGENPEHKDTVTVRDRDTGEQTRMPVADAIRKVKESI